MGYVDSHPITTYDSVSRRKEPRAPWMAEHLEPDHWERYTQLLRGWQQTFKVELERLQRHYNHSAGECSRLRPLPGPHPGPEVPGLTACVSFCQVALSVAFGKAWTIWLMGFSACHLPYASSQLSATPRSPLSFAPHIPIPISFRLATCTVSFPSRCGHSCLISWGPGLVSRSLMHHDL